MDSAVLFLVYPASNEYVLLHPSLEPILFGSRMYYFQKEQEFLLSLGFRKLESNQIILCKELN